ncbi:unnamed protein product [Nesidiocoris tenuis]|uniref:WW domain-containing protein n=1 Tax=Nesidiocoris tenuis TaxID=355587 RepID=A0A6H5H4Z1_9HEMI|nr:unnamed protein product [Nesidiocoris tenuis]
MSSASWEFNPAYRCSLTDRRGFFKNLVDEALRSVGELHLDSRLSTFDDVLDVGENDDDSEIPDTEASFDDSSYDYLNLILYGFKEIVRRLNSLERPSVSRHVLDREFLRSCQEAMAMIDDELSGSMDNHIGTDRRLKWDDVSADDVSADDASADVSATMDYVSTDRQSQLSDSSDDVKSETSDIVAWKCDIYDSAYDEYNFDIVDCRGGDVEWHSASDNSGRIYFFKENSSESSWTLPCQSPSPQPPNNVDSSPPPNPQQIITYYKLQFLQTLQITIFLPGTETAIMPPKLKPPELVNTKLGSIGEAPAEEQTTTSKKGGSNIGRSKSVNFKNKDDSIEDLGGSPAERQVKIKARLRKFFHKRPTMDSLVKKGIWKDFNRMLVANLAIVFGPTLMWPEQESQNMASELMQQNMVIEALLLDFPQIFK